MNIGVCLEKRAKKKTPENVTVKSTANACHHFAIPFLLSQCTLNRVHHAVSMLWLSAHLSIGMTKINYIYEPFRSDIANELFSHSAKCSLFHIPAIRNFLPIKIWDLSCVPLPTALRATLNPWLMGTSRHFVKR
jgi:hypothetical protein